MKKIFAAILSICLILVVVFGELPTEVSAYGDIDNFRYELNEDGESYSVYCIAAVDGHTEIPAVYNGKPVTRIGDNAFYGIRLLTGVTIPEGVTDIGESAFYGCPCLNDITIPASVVSIGDGAFAGCYSLTGIWVDENNAYYSSDDRGVLFNKDKTLLIQAPTQLSGKYSILDSVTYIGDYAFSGCVKLSYVYFIGDVPEFADNAFHAVHVTASYPSDNPTWTFEVLQDYGGTITWEPAAPEDIGLIFSLNSDGGGYSVSAWKTDASGTLEIPCTYNGKPVTSICNGAFCDCTSLTSITIPDSVTSIGENAFAGCDSLTGIWVDESNAYYSSDECGVLFNKDKTVLLRVPGGFSGSYSIPSSVISIGARAFYGCTHLKSITIPDSVTSIGGEAFYGCSIKKLIIADGSKVVTDVIVVCEASLEEVIIPDSVTCIGDFAFSGCRGLTNIAIPNSVTSIGSHAFLNCRNLTSIILPDSVTCIGSSAFCYCDSLTSMTFPDSVTFVGYGVFAFSDNITTVYFMGDAPEFGGESFEYSRNLTAYYPCGNPTWTPEVLQNYGGSITWIPYSPEDLRQENVVRVFGATRYETAFGAADMLKELQGVEKFQTIVVACGTDFADALSGSYLANQKNAPILLVRNRNQEIDQVKAYIRNNLAAGGTVYLLGGTAAIPASMETGLDGFTVKRLAGATRYETNLAILKEAGVGDKDVLVCTGKNFADGLSASAVNLPILLVKDSLNSNQTEFLKSLGGGNKIYIIGGTNAVNKNIAGVLATYGAVEWIEGATRYETSVNIAKEFFADADCAVLAYGNNFPDGLSGGALAYALNAPLILTADGKESAAVTYATAAGIDSGVVLGGSGLISDKVVRKIFQLSSGGLEITAEGTQANRKQLDKNGE